MVLLSRGRRLRGPDPRRHRSPSGAPGPGPTATSASRPRASDPLADQSTDKFAPLADERAHAYPHRTDNAYPYAFDTIAQLFDHPAAPDLCVIHSAAHNWEDQGGHRGEHGSLGVVQARAPFVIAGKGVRNDGLVAASGRLVDVAPDDLPAARRARRTTTAPTSRGQDGEVRARRARPRRPAARST